MRKETDNPEHSKKGRNWFIRNFVKLIIVAAVVAALSFVTKIPKKTEETSVSEAPPVNVEVMKIKPESEFADTFKLPAVIEPNRIVTVSAEVEGRIESIPVIEGTKIKAGDELIKLNTDILQPQLNRAEAQLERDKIEYHRMYNLVENNATAKSDLDDAKTKMDVSQAQFDEIKAKLDRTTIRAPISGILNKVLVEEGEYIQSGKAVAEIVDNDKVKVVVDVPERDISFFTTGKETQVEATYQDKEKVHSGKITFISQVADSLTRSTPMEITLDNKDKCLHSGQIVDVVLTRQVLKNVVMIPLEAVIPMENGNAVYIANSPIAKRREVELGIIKGDNVQIKSGLEEGDKLIISGHRFVVPGQTVNVVLPENQ
jgi:membrane fusion protein (multidrug efflux system)